MTENKEQAPENEQVEDENSEQPLISHLIELRNRLLRSLGVILVLFLGIFPYGNDLYIIISQPLLDVLPEGSNMIATSPTSPFMIPATRAGPEKSTLCTAFSGVSVKPTDSPSLGGLMLMVMRRSGIRRVI